MRDRGEALAWVTVAALAVAASATSITNGFAFDDTHIIQGNAAVHSIGRWWEFFAQSYWPPEKGGDLYRPFTMIAFAAQWVAGDGSPRAFHLTSILLYALTCAGFMAVARSLLPLAAAWLAAALFAVHPLHVEAVGNVVGQAELWAALFMLIALALFLRARHRGRLAPVYAIAIAVLYVLAVLSKEHAIVFPLVLLAAELTVAPRTRDARQRWAELGVVLLVLSATAVAFVLVRGDVLATTRGAPPEVSPLFAGQPFGIRAMTMLRVVLEWTRLLFWPARLSADYSPRHIDIATGFSPDMLLSVAIIGAAAAVAWKARRVAPVVTFAIAWLGISLLIPSNLLIPTGFVLAERTLFVPSAAAMLFVGATAMQLMPRLEYKSRASRRIAAAAIGVLILAGIVASARRQRVWRDNPTLFAQTVRDAPTSYRARMAYSTVLFERGQRAEGLEQIRIAQALFPRDIAVLEYAAEQHARGGNCARAKAMFDSVLSQDRLRSRSRTRLASCLIMMGEHDRARAVIRAGLGIGQPESALRQLLSINDSVQAAKSKTN